jgi:hypothetical protein
MLDTQHAKPQKRYGGEVSDGLGPRYVRSGTDFVAEVSDRSGEAARSDFSRAYPRPANGMAFAMIVMNMTLVSSGRLAM